MFSKFKIFFLVLSALLLITPIFHYVNADEISDLEKKLEELRNTKNTLSTQIEYLESQYELTLLKITQTENSITALEKEIAGLNVEISKLEVQINDLSATYINQIIQSYKLQKKYPSFAYLLSDNLNTFLEQHQYISSIQANSKQSLINMETVRYDYDKQKTTKEEKQAELEALKKTLASQKISLANQKVAKDQLLKTTEAEYNQVQQQLAALKSFASSVGGSTCLDSSPGGGSDGNFYSQRDPRWCKKYIGISNDTVGSVGCFISSVSMVYKKIGHDTTPLSYASNPDNFWGNTAYMLKPTPPSGYNYQQVSYSANTVDNELKAGRYVIAQVKMANVSGMHFIVIISGSNGNYKIHDPWFGSDQDFSKHYSTGLIMSLRLITK